MSIAQQLGQWFGVTMIAVVLGYIGYRLLRLALWIRDALERRRRAAAFGELVGEKAAAMAQPRNLTVGGRVIREHRDRNGVRVVEAIELTDVGADPYEWGDVRKYGQPPRPELMIASPPCEQFRRGMHLAVSLPSRRGGKTEEARRLKQLWELAHERPYSTPAEAMLLGFAGNRNGEIAVGARLDFERSIMDGDRPSSIEPRGIFGATVAEHDARRREQFEKGTGRTDWPFP